MIDLLPCPQRRRSRTRLGVWEEGNTRPAMDSFGVKDGKQDPPDAKKRRVVRPGVFTIVFVLALPLVLVFFLFGDQVASITAGSLVWQDVNVQGTQMLLLLQLGTSFA
jgi:hypothetical protein